MNLAISVIGEFMGIVAGLVVPVKLPVPVPFQELNLWPTLGSCRVASAEADVNVVVTVPARWALRRRSSIFTSSSLVMTFRTSVFVMAIGLGPTNKPQMRLQLIIAA